MKKCSKYVSDRCIFVIVIIVKAVQLSVKRQLRYRSLDNFANHFLNV